MNAPAYGSPADVAKRIAQYLIHDDRRNSATQLLYEAMKALRAPAAGDARDSERLQWIAQSAWAIRDLENGRKNALVWQQPRTSTVGALDRLRAAIDAAIAAQQQGDAL